jgi:hypothetical protein
VVVIEDALVAVLVTHVRLATAAAVEHVAEDLLEFALHTFVEAERRVCKGCQAAAGTARHEYEATHISGEEVCQGEQAFAKRKVRSWLFTVLKAQEHTFLEPPLQMPTARRDACARRSKHGPCKRPFIKWHYAHHSGAHVLAVLLLQ